MRGAVEARVDGGERLRDLLVGGMRAVATVPGARRGRVAATRPADVSLVVLGLRHHHGRA